MLVLLLLWSLVEVHSQTAPYVSFMGENLPNHSYVDLTLVGTDNSDPGNTGLTRAGAMSALMRMRMQCTRKYSGSQWNKYKKIK